MHHAYFTQGFLLFITYEPVPDAHEIFKRFAKVFEQTYTRFLDLKKAEAQAKEAQIEAGLERVRSRTMAMHKSDELAETAVVLFKQMIGLGIEPNRLYIAIINDNSGDLEFWISDENGDKVSSRYMVNINKNISIKKMYEGWTTKKKTITIDMQGKELEDWLTYWRKEFHVPFKPGAALKRRIQNIAYFSKGFIAIASPDDQPESTISLLERFAAVFNLTYTRFSDLQQAEAQAREAQIQLALERVRAGTMAMQRSDELPGAATILFQQVQSLGMPAFAAGYCIWDEDKQAITLWMSSEGILQPPFKAPTTEDELFIEMRKGHEEGKSFHVVEMGGKKLVAHYQYMRTLPVVGEIFDSIIEAGPPLPTFQIMHHSYFSKGFLLFITYEPVPDAHDIFKRFGKVFDQTYTRFIDLQKAEAQAREAQIEAALEKVRSRSLAMHKSDELYEVVTVVSEKLVELDIAFDGGAAIVIFTGGSKDLTFWIASNSLPTAVCFRLPYFDHPMVNVYA